MDSEPIAYLSAKYDVSYVILEKDAPTADARVVYLDDHYKVLALNGRQAYPAS
jgi:hypothetical protein